MSTKYPRRKASTPIAPRETPVGLRQAGGSAWALWVLGYMLGGTAGSLIGNAITSILTPGTTDNAEQPLSIAHVLGSVAGNFLWGAILGLALWLVLYRYLRNVAWLPVLTGAGLALGTMVASIGFPLLFPGVVNLTGNDPLSVLTEAANGAVIGLVVGVAQAALLLRRISDTASMVTFVLTSALGWLGLVLLDYLFLSVVSGGTRTDPLLSIIILLAGFALAGTISGFEVPALISKYQKQMLEETKPDVRAPAARPD